MAKPTLEDRVLSVVMSVRMLPASELLSMRRFKASNTGDLETAVNSLIKKGKIISVNSYFSGSVEPELVLMIPEKKGL